MRNEAEEHPGARLKERSEELYRQWCSHKKEEFNVGKFPGVSTDDITDAEDLFGLNIYIHQLYIGVEEDVIDEEEEDLADLIEQAESTPERQTRLNELLADAAEQGLIENSEAISSSSDDDSESSSLSGFVVEDDGEALVEAQHFMYGTPSPPSQLPEEPAPEPQAEPPPASSQLRDAPAHPRYPSPRPPPPSPVPTEISTTSSYVQQRIQARTVRRPLATTPGRSTLHLLQFRDHYHRIMSINTLCRSWKCQRCSKYFTKFGNCKRHQKNCKRKTKYIYKGGGYRSKPTVFERLRKDGLNVADQFYQHRIVVDCECRFEEIPQPSEPRRLRHLNELIPLSGSTISTFDEENGKTNAEGRMGRYNEPEFFENRDPKVMVKQLYEYMKEMAEKIGDRMAEKYERELQFAKNNADLARDAIRQLKEARQTKDDEQIAIALNRYYTYKENIYTEQMLQRWVRQVPTIGFNSGRFDINLLRQYLLPLIAEDSQKKVSIIERGTDFMAIGTDSMVWLDMMHYVPPGTNLDSFIKAYCPDAGDWKYFWPYEHITGYDVLKEGRPERHMFSSYLKKREMTEEEYAAFCDLWERHGCKTLMDWLRIYNNQDVVPFLKAIGKMFEIFKGLGIDMFKQAISLPGVAMQRMFSQQGQTIFPLFSKKYKEWHHCFKDNIVGGPAIVFRRSLGSFDTLRTNTFVRCKKVLGYDANSLYLGCTGKKMPTGIPRQYQPTDDIGVEVPTTADTELTAEECKARVKSNMAKKFKYNYMCRSSLEVPWIIFKTRELAAKTGKELTVEHAYNGGQRVVLSPDGKRRYYLDGYIPELNKALEFNGCYFHGHDCHVEKDRIREHQFDKRPELIERRKARYEAYEQRRRDLEELGMTVDVHWECQWVGNDDGEEDRLKEVIKEILPPMRRKYVPVQAQRILDEVESGQFFGAVECDLQVCSCFLVRRTTGYMVLEKSVPRWHAFTFSSFIGTLVGHREARIHERIASHFQEH